MGQSYALPTKDATISPKTIAQVKERVLAFLDHARERPDLTFVITPVGTGLSKLSNSDMAHLFVDAPANCYLPAEWVTHFPEGSDLYLSSLDATWRWGMEHPTTKPFPK